MLCLLGGLLPKAAAAVSPDLTFIELKPTGSESVVILNTSSATLNLQNYLLEYFNKPAPTSLAQPTDSQTLPSVTLAPNQSLLLNNDGMATCGAAAVAGLSLSLSDSGGYLAIVKVSTQPDGSLIYQPQDHVGWTTATTGADIVKVPSATANPTAIWYRKLSTGAWQQAQQNGDCSILLAMTTPPASTTFVQWATGDDPPAAFATTDPNQSGPALPAADVGLAAPKLNEILPNPADPQTDSEDEFIELYNPNDTVFDLSGFKFQVGTTTLHTYTIPSGTTIEARGFKAFMSIDTNLSLSNSGGQAVLLDPLSNAISQTDVYGSAPDGQAWALADGKWYWSTTPTAGAANVISQSLTTQALDANSAGPVLVQSTASPSATKKVTATAAKSTTKATTAKTATKAASTTKPKTTTTASSTAGSSVKQASPVHWAILAGVGVLALLYALYEYRHDLANRYHQLRRNRALGRKLEQVNQAATSDRIKI